MKYIVASTWIAFGLGISLGFILFNNPVEVKIIDHCYKQTISDTQAYHRDKCPWEGK